ncbi:MAG: diaminopimelate epimerase [Johnsonella sp.]|nr:diaminopimelate epimerase [Johnsonella sp.]
MKFVKMQGIGNDYVYVDCFLYEVKNPPAVARIVSDRHYGIGSDGLILICPSERADVKMEMYNADGSKGKMCGNGARCVAKYAYEQGYVKKTKFLIETAAGNREAQLELRDQKIRAVRIDMGIPILESNLPEKILIKDAEEEFVGISMGNPHAVYYVKSAEELHALDLEKWGRYYEEHPRFPDKVNSEFVFIESPKRIHMRVWERGSGETLACGTGAAASAYASMLLGKCEDEVEVCLRGGNLKIRLDRESEHIHMSGEAVEVFRGEIRIEEA